MQIEMKIAIASTGNKKESTISMLFARCEYFAVFDTITTKLEFIENISRKKKEHVGIEVANSLVKLGVKKIISGEFGTSIRSVTDPNKIQLIYCTAWLCGDMIKTCSHPHHHGHGDHRGDCSHN